MFRTALELPRLPLLPRRTLEFANLALFTHNAVDEAFSCILHPPPQCAKSWKRGIRQRRTEGMLIDWAREMAD